MKTQFRFHLLGLTHLPQARRYSSCAYTQKNLKLARMLIELGHQVFFYGSEGSEAFEYCRNSDRLVFIQTHTLADIRRDYGDGDNRFELGYDWRLGFRHDLESGDKPSTQKFRQACIEIIKAISQPDDFLLLTMGLWHQPIADEVGLVLRCEPGIGYTGSSAKNFRAFECDWLRYFAYGSEHPYRCHGASPLDRVIPNYFDPDDFRFQAEKEPFHLFLGRVIRNKGIEIAARTCSQLGIPLKIAGQHGQVQPDGSLLGLGVQVPPGSWEYLGPVGPDERRELLARAQALWCPTLYIEPFGGVHIEALLSGTPVITTDWGIFPVTVPDHLVGRIGFRCNTGRDYVRAAQEVAHCDPVLARRWAEQFLMDRVALKFQTWFEDLYRAVILQESVPSGFGD